MVEKVWPCDCKTDAFFRVTVPGMEEVNAAEDSYLSCEWEEEHQGKEIQGCTKDNCYNYDSLGEARTLRFCNSRNSPSLTPLFLFHPAFPAIRFCSPRVTSAVVRQY